MVHLLLGLFGIGKDTNMNASVVGGRRLQPPEHQRKELKKTRKQSLTTEP